MDRMEEPTGRIEGGGQFLHDLSLYTRLHPFPVVPHTASAYPLCCRLRRMRCVTDRSLTKYTRWTPRDVVHDRMAPQHCLPRAFAFAAEYMHSLRKCSNKSGETGAKSL
eukprot:gene12268-biopygen2604